LLGLVAVKFKSCTYLFRGALVLEKDGCVWENEQWEYLNTILCIICRGITVIIPAFLECLIIEDLDVVMQRRFYKLGKGSLGEDDTNGESQVFHFHIFYITALDFNILIVDCHYKER
jgi:hypothetical protein